MRYFSWSLGCDASATPEIFHRQVFDSHHNLAHQGVRQKHILQICLTMHCYACSTLGMRLHAISTVLNTATQQSNFWHVFHFGRPIPTHSLMYCCRFMAWPSTKTAMTGSRKLASQIQYWRTRTHYPNATTGSLSTWRPRTAAYQPQTNGMVVRMHPNLTKTHHTVICQSCSLPNTASLLKTSTSSTDLRNGIFAEIYVEGEVCFVGHDDMQARFDRKSNKK